MKHADVEISSSLNKKIPHQCSVRSVRMFNRLEYIYIYNIYYIYITPYLYASLLSTAWRVFFLFVFFLPYTN